MAHFGRQNYRKLLVELIKFASEWPTAVQMYHQEVALEYLSDFLDASVAGIRLRLPPILQIIAILEHRFQMLLDVKNGEFAHKENKFGDFSS